MRPTIAQIAEACAHFERHLNDLADDDQGPAKVLIDAVNPPTDEEVVQRYDEFLKRKGYRDIGNALAWFADGVGEFIGRNHTPKHHSVTIERPENLWDLAELVAKNLRDRGLMAFANRTRVCIGQGAFWPYEITQARFDGLNALECANLIHVCEVKRAREAAGDEPSEASEDNP